MLIPSKVLHLFSGGLDSTVMLYDMIHDGAKPRCLGFYYGQRHVRELDCARNICRQLNVPWEIRTLDKMFEGSYLTGDGDGVVVPNRNAVMLHAAIARAVVLGAEVVTIACNHDDKSTFPDCTWEFIDAINATVKAAKLPVEVRAPYAGLTKWQIIQRGRELGIDFDQTWSCYAGSHDPCGKCAACELRKSALA